MSRVGKTTHEATRWRASGLVIKPRTTPGSSALGETRPAPYSDGAVRKALDAAVAAYREQPKPHAYSEYSEISRALDEAVLAAEAAGWGPAAIGRRFLASPTNVANAGRGAILRAHRRLNR